MEVIIILAVVAALFFAGRHVYRLGRRPARQPADAYFHHTDPSDELREAIERFAAERVEDERSENIRNAETPIPLDKIQRNNPYDGIDLEALRRRAPPARPIPAVQVKRHVAARVPPRPAGTVRRTGSSSSRRDDDYSYGAGIYTTPDTSSSSSSSSSCDYGSSSSSSSSDSGSSSCSTD